LRYDISQPAIQKAHPPVRDNLDPDSNITEESDLHRLEQFQPKTSTDAGRTISTKPVSLNAHPSIRDNLDSDSNVTEKSDLQSEKQSSRKTSTNAGIITNFKPISEKTFLLIRPILESFSKATDFDPSLLETLSHVMNWVDEGIN
jgi:hypothetical protein